MKRGKCHLCGEVKDLLNSHVWPSFAYKKYVSNLDKGGQFADLNTQTLSNRQFKRFWFCAGCEQLIGKDEKYASELLDGVAADPTKDHAYDDRLLRFLVSISWRTLKFQHDGMANSAVENKWEAAKVWKRYTRGSAPGVKAYSQHVFNIIDNRFGLDKMLGGRLITEQGLVLSQIGPLLIVGHLNPDGLSSEERITWSNSKVLSKGGSVAPIREWRTGTKDPSRNNITIRFCYLLKSFELAVIDKVVSGNWSGRPKTRSPLPNAEIP